MRTTVIRGWLLLGLATSLAAACTHDEEVDTVVREGQVFTQESDGNDTPATATPLVGTDGVVLGHINTFTDNDYYSFTALAGDKLYAATATAYADVSSDSALGLYAADGTT